MSQQAKSLLAPSRQVPTSTMSHHQTRHPKDRQQPSEKTGVWLIGARGGLATTLLVGARFIARGLVSTSGLLSETEGFSKLQLVPLQDLVFGGHEIRAGTLMDSAREIARETHTIDLEKLHQVAGDLAVVDREIKQGTALNCGSTIRSLACAKVRNRHGGLKQTLLAIKQDLRSFRERHRLKRLIVVNLASTEPPLLLERDHHSIAGFERILAEGRTHSLRASSLYAWAAVSSGCAFINFTPSLAAMLPAIQRKAKSARLPLMGSDGKTGETLVKSALAPMFKYRNLRILTWQGYNILGDRDGQVLADDRNKQAKIKSKDLVLSSILGYPLHTHVGIDFVPSLNDLKTAWDFIHFRGFLDFKMSMQFTWQGCDAVLAAPLVLDMVRMAAYALDQGESGLMTQLSCFFKNPCGVDQQDLHFQFHHLMHYVEAHVAGKSWKSGLVARPGEKKLPRPGSPK